MHEVKLSLILFVLIYFIYVGNSEMRGLEGIPERAEITYSNDKYVVNNTINVRRYSRRGSYVVNFWGYIKKSWANNVTIDAIFHEYLHNEYKRSFVEMHFKWCDLINKDPLFGGPLRLLGLKCPTEIGYVGIFNATFFFPKFPYVIPFERVKIEVTFMTEPLHEVIGKGNLYLSSRITPESIRAYIEETQDETRPENQDY